MGCPVLVGHRWCSAVAVAASSVGAEGGKEMMPDSRTLSLVDCKWPGNFFAGYIGFAVGSFR